MVMLEALLCLFPSNLAMLAWQMMKGMLVLGACQLMSLGDEYCPSRHDCLGGAFARCSLYSSSLDFFGESWSNSTSAPLRQDIVKLRFDMHDEFNFDHVFPLAKLLDACFYYCPGCFEEFFMI